MIKHITSQAKYTEEALTTEKFMNVHSSGCHWLSKQWAAAVGPWNLDEYRVAPPGCGLVGKLLYYYQFAGEEFIMALIDFLSLCSAASFLTPTIKPSLLKNWNTAQGHPWNEDTSLIFFPPPQNSIYLQPSLIWMNNIGVLISDTRMNVKPCLNLQGPPRVVRS